MLRYLKTVARDPHACGRLRRNARFMGVVQARRDQRANLLKRRFHVSPALSSGLQKPFPLNRPDCPRRCLENDFRFRFFRALRRENWGRYCCLQLHLFGFRGKALQLWPADAHDAFELTRLSPEDRSRRRFAKGSGARAPEGPSLAREFEDGPGALPPKTASAALRAAKYGASRSTSGAAKAWSR